MASKDPTAEGFTLSEEATIVGGIKRPGQAGFAFRI
jgi:hypothetical protein